MADCLQPTKVNFGIFGGCEAAAHAVHIYTSSPSPDSVLFKADVRSAFNLVCRDNNLKSVHHYIPSVLPFVQSAYCLPSILRCDPLIIQSEEGVQKGDSMGSLLFYLALKSVTSGLPLDGIDVNIWYLNDGSIASRYDSIAAVFNRIKKEVPSLGSC